MPAVPSAAAIETDALVIGAGPAGLFQAFELGLLDLKAHIVDSLAVPGGQCTELYGSKPIYDIPGIPVCTAQELIDRLMLQLKPFNPGFHLGQQVETLQARDDGRFDVATAIGTRFIAKTVFVAGGAGSFQARRLKLDGIEAFEDAQVFYSVDDATRFAGRRVVVHGGSDLALEAVLKLAEAPAANAPASITLVYRRDVFQAAPDLIARVNKQRDAGVVNFVAGQITGLERQGDLLTGLQVTAGDTSVQTLPLDSLLIALGFSPKLGPIAEWGLALERRQVVVDTAKFQTSVPGLYAVGDVVTYPGKRKLILSGFHEATLAAFAAAEQLRGEPQQLLYTTTSTKLHKLLGVDSPESGESS
jgi:thioredoxin reductase (NADPH)